MNADNSAQKKVLPSSHTASSQIKLPCCIITHMKIYVVVSILEENFPQHFLYEDWPLHVTLIKNFSSREDLSNLLSILSDVSFDQKVVTVSGKCRENFGINKDVCVTELESTNEFESLLTDLQAGFKDLIEPFGPQYESYRPHVADRHYKKIDIGEIVRIDSISLVELIGNERQVLDTFKFK